MVSRRRRASRSPGLLHDQGPSREPLLRRTKANRCRASELSPTGVCEGVDLVSLMLQQAREDLFQATLPSQNLKLSFGGIASSSRSVSSAS